MYKFKRLLVCLDLTASDESLINTTFSLTKYRFAEHIYFIHIVRSLHLPEHVDEKYRHIVLPADEKLINEMKDEISAKFSDFYCDVSVEVKEGNPADQILKWAKLKEIDLIVMGKKSFGLGTGVHSDKVVNLAHCSVIFIPENFTPDLKTIVLPVDFSEASHKAFQKAVQIAGSTHAVITCFHVYEVPTGYHATGLTFDEFKEVMLQNAEKDYNTFLETEDTTGVTIQARYELDHHSHPDKLIVHLASEINADLIIIGSKGRTALSSILIGSVAVKVINATKDIPLLIVKSKGENLGLLDAILEL